MVFVGSFLSVWGHAFLDHLKHFWFYFAPQYQHLKSLKMVYVCIDQKPHRPSPNFFAMLSALGIRIEQMQEVEKPTRFRRIFVPDECFFCDLNHHHTRRYTKEYLTILSHLPALPAPDFPVEKVYFSRTQFILWKDFNEIEVERFFKKQGFTIIYPEKLSFKENLQILQHCRIFAATDGSIGHNLLFCQNAKTALILRKCRHFTPYQCTINALKKEVEVVYIDAAFSPFADHRDEWWSGPFFLYESNALRAYFHLPPKGFPLIRFLQFLRWHYRRWFSFFYWDHLLLGFTHPLRARLKIGSRLKKIVRHVFPR